MNLLLLILNYSLFIFIIVFSIKNLYENFYTNKAYIFIIILILCIISLEFSFIGVKVCNDIVVAKMTRKYSINDIIIPAVIAIISIGIAYSLIKINKDIERDKKERFLKENNKNWEKFYKILRKKK